MELGIKNKTALITGASKGLGFYIASALAKEGCNIGICARNKDEIKSAEKFYVAEQYHQSFFTNNPYQPYCQFIVAPKVIKLRQKHAELLKVEHSHEI